MIGAASFASRDDTELAIHYICGNQIDELGDTVILFKPWTYVKYNIPCEIAAVVEEDIKRLNDNFSTGYIRMYPKKKWRSHFELLESCEKSEMSYIGFLFTARG